jgi:hypothetical protein
VSGCIVEWRRRSKERDRGLILCFALILELIRERKKGPRI